MLWLYENIFQELFQIWNIFPFAQRNENEIAYECKAKRKLKRATHKFSNEQNHKKSYSKTTFRIILLFSLTEINRTPRSLL